MLTEKTIYINPILGGLLEVCFEVGAGGGVERGVKLSPVKNLLELRQKLEIWHISTLSYVVSENIPFRTKALLIFLMSIIFCKKSAIYGQYGIFTQSNSVRAV